MASRRLEINVKDHSHYALDYRIVVENYRAIQVDRYRSYDYPAGLDRGCHEQIADIIAVLSNLGYQSHCGQPTDREWQAGKWQDWHNGDASTPLFQVKAFKNGNLHYRFNQKAIKRLNVEAGRLLGWLRTPEDAVKELGYSPRDVSECWNTNTKLLPSNIKLLAEHTNHA